MKFEPLTESHLPLLLEWFGRPHVAQWWDDTLDIDALRIKYLGLPAQQEVQRFIVMREAEAFGYIQKYRAFDHGDGWWRGWTDRSVVGIDQFIADEKNLGRGLGT
ncbi:MAG: GNAT family N-acetyltransferase, partial [Casimicrobiaceae bacterium]